MSGNFVETLVLDMRYSLRVLRKSPGFTVVAVLTLALAIGANAVVFGVLDGLILRPLNVPRADGLYGIERSDEDDPVQSYPDYLDLRDRNRSFESLAAYPPRARPPSARLDERSPLFSSRSSVA